MPTPSEQKALAFLAIIGLLGGAVRVVRAGAVPQATPLEQQALARQLAAVDSATGAKRKKGTVSPKVARNKRDTVAKSVAGVATVPPTYARPDDPFSHTPYGERPTVDRRGFPPPGPRIDVGAPASLSIPGVGASRRTAAPAAGPIDLDTATPEQIDRLPRAGPALAARIVANRDSLGPFRRLEVLRRVKGIGPATLEKWAPLVTFSGGSGGSGAKPAPR